ncbi:WGR domain-containing protein [Chitinophaga sancti]|uniref:WGR domain-containing protein n=1 Tax=Chitinophaga sancti TaxID=1004 RepID=A0A1K1M5F7_9BACT|nr:WGR domain-containing protein [Chitinophaga sancti]WQD64690.1 WGR domain-containing protein [Chitinophaga sancti]WQG89688.1 WGR domain-containing protein [Chitinophaga sancti]SFW17198.1 WGR domain-containing protein, predicted DNA-binding domain in MolR [Chitinophaga sancti]
MMQYFEFQDENGACFFEIRLEDRIVRTRSGQKGTPGITMEKIFRDAGTAAAEFNRLTKEKENDAFYFRLGDEYSL